jgi:hypothetical protein
MDNRRKSTNHLKSTNRSLSVEIFSVNENKDRSWISKEYDAESFHRDTSEPITILTGASTKYATLFYMPNMILLLFARKYSIRLLVGTFTLYLCIAILTGTLVIVFTAQKQPSMFFWFYIFCIQHDKKSRPDTFL